MTSIEQQVDRNYCIENQTDAFGNKWEVFHIKGTALYELHVVEGNKRINRDNPLQEDPSKVSIKLSGRYTKPQYALETLTKYLNVSWDAADKKNKKKEQEEKRRLHKSKVANAPSPSG